MAQNLTAPDVAAIIGFAQRNMPYLFNRLTEKMDLRSKGFDVMTGVKNKVPMMKLSFGKGLKPATGNFVSKGNAIYSNRDLVVEEYQRDLQVYAKKYLRTYLDYLRGQGENAANATIPMKQQFNEGFIDQLAEEMALEVVYFGLGKAAFTAYNPANAYAVGNKIAFTANAGDSDNEEVRYYICLAAAAAGHTPETHPAKWEDISAKAICKGIGTYLAEAITNGDITPVVTGAVSNTNAYEACVDVYRDLDPQFKNSKLINMYISHDVYADLLDNVEDSVAKNFVLMDGLLTLPKSAGKVKIIPLSEMGTSQRIIATLPKNFVQGVDSESDLNDIDIQKINYKLHYMVQGVVGFQIADTDAISCNNVA